MANKFVALLLVVCLVAAAGVDAIDERTMKCMDSCVTYQCGENPSTFCTILCKLGCATSSGLANGKFIYLHICVILLLHVLWNIGITKFNKASTLLINQRY